MTVTIQAQFRRSIPEQNRYEVRVDIINATGIDLDVLVFDTETSGFSHVATVYDIETYPVGQTVAAAGNIAFFRDRGTINTFAQPGDATNFEVITKARLQVLAEHWDTIVGEFDGTVVYTADSSTTAS
jgi:hypothetical protein